MVSVPGSCGACVHCQQQVLLSQQRIFSDSPQGYMHSRCGALLKTLQQIGGDALQQHTSIVDSLHSRITELEASAFCEAATVLTLQTTIDELVASVPQSKVVVAISEALHEAAQQEQQLRTELRRTSRTLDASSAEISKMHSIAEAQQVMHEQLRLDQDALVSAEVESRIKARRSQSQEKWLSPSVDVTQLAEGWSQHPAWGEAFGHSRSPSREPQCGQAAAADLCPPAETLSSRKSWQLEAPAAPTVLVQAVTVAAPQFVTVAAPKMGFEPSAMGFSKLKSHLQENGFSKAQVDSCMSKDSLLQLAKWGAHPKNPASLSSIQMRNLSGVNIRNVQMSEVA